MQSLRPHAPTQGWPIKSCRIASSCISLLNKQVTSPSPNRVTQTSPCQSSTSDRDGSHRIERRVCKRNIRKVIERELMCIEINLENACTQGLARAAIRAATKGRDAKTVKNDPGYIFATMQHHEDEERKGKDAAHHRHKDGDKIQRFYGETSRSREQDERARLGNDLYGAEGQACTAPCDFTSNHHRDSRPFGQNQNKQSPVK